MDEKKEIWKRLETVLSPFKLRDVEMSMNMYLWLAYNDLTIEDMRLNLDHIRHAKTRDSMNRGRFYRGPKEYEELPYVILKLMQNTLKRIKSGEVTVDNLQEFYRAERKRILENQTYGPIGCAPCKKKAEWPMEVLR